MIASGLIRLSGGFSRVWATETVPSETGEMLSTQPQAELGCSPDGGTAALLLALRQREAQAVAGEEALAQRTQAISLAEGEIDARMNELVAAEEALAATLAIADKAAEQDLARLTAVYENMKPKDAALLFSEMEPDFAAGFLARMRPEAAAGVMTGLDPKTAYALSAVLAGRNAMAPKN